MRKDMQAGENGHSALSTPMDSTECVSPAPALFLDVHASPLASPATGPALPPLRSESPADTLVLRSESPFNDMIPSPPHSPCSSGSSNGQLARTHRRSSLARVSSGVVSARYTEANLCAIYIQTFLVFPAMSLKWQPKDSFMSREDYGLLIVSVYQAFDLVGRLVCTWPKLIRCFPSGDKVWIFVFLRTLLLPFFFVCWLHPVSIFQTCSMQTALVGLLGLSNGILTNLAFLHGTKVASHAELDIVGRALPLFLGLGIVLGTALSSMIIAAYSAIPHQDPSRLQNSTATISF